MNFAKATCLVICTVMLAHPGVEGRLAVDSENRQPQSFQAANPSYQIASHTIGNINLPVTSNGTLGMQYYPFTAVDAFTGQLVPTWQFPQESLVDYLYGAALWVGAVTLDSLFREDTLRAGDTLPNGDTIPPGSTVVIFDTLVVDRIVSESHDGWRRTANELVPDESPAGDLVMHSTIDPSNAALFAGAVSHLDYEAVYTDTFPESEVAHDPDYFNDRPHVPLNIEVSQKSYSWGYSHTEDFVLVSYDITNIGSQSLDSVYAGLFMDGDVCFECPTGSKDDIAGFIRQVPSLVEPAGCGFSDTVNLAWIADNDGDFERFSDEQALHVTGISVLGAPGSGSAPASFNWWLSSVDSAQDWGPRAIADIINFGTGTDGTPDGDVNKYHFLSNGEIDYDQAYTATITQADGTWRYPDPTYSADWAMGGDTRFLLSFGPFSIDSGETIPLTLAYVAGEDLHTDAGNIDNLPDNPAAYYAGLDFSDLGNNAVWAKRVYDNPGLDTDSNGYRGEMRICPGTDDTTWYTGDGVPDFKVPSVIATGTAYSLDIDSVDCAVYDSAAAMWRQPSKGTAVSIYSPDGATLLATTRTDSCGIYTLQIPLAAEFCLGLNSDHCAYTFQTTLNTADTANLDFDLTAPLSVDVDDQPGDRPLTFGLTQNYPNPFNPATTISYNLATRSLVELSVYNMLGQKVTTLVNDVQAAGQHQAEWDGTNRSGNRVASGIYFYRLEAGEQSVVKKMVLLK